MATKKFPSECNNRGVVKTTDKVLIYNSDTGASDEYSTVGELTLNKANLSGGNIFNGDQTFNNSIIMNNSLLLYAQFLYSASINSLRTWNGTGFEVVGGFQSVNEVGGGRLVIKQGRLTGLLEGNGQNITGLGKIGLGVIEPVYLIDLASDSAGKPGAGGLWTVTSDERIKKDIQLADLDICYETIKNIPLKRFAWADGVYSEEQVRDRHNLGWIAQDVQKYFAKAVSVKQFTKNEKIEDGIEEYQEQDFIMEDKETTTIEVIDGQPTQVRKTTQEKTMLFDELEVKDENGNIVIQDGKPELFKIPRMVTKTRPKFRQETIDDCLDLNSGQLYAAMYGALQKTIQKIEVLEKEIALLKL